MINKLLNLYPKTFWRVCSRFYRTI